VADGIGRRAIKFSSGGRYLGEVGRAGDVSGLGDAPPVGSFVDADTWYSPTQPPAPTSAVAPTPTPRRPGRPLGMGDDTAAPPSLGSLGTDDPDPVLAFALGDALGDVVGDPMGDPMGDPAADPVGHPDGRRPGDRDVVASDAGAAAPHALAQATPPPGDEIVWLVDEAMHSVVVVDRASGARWVLGTPGEAGDDDDHLRAPSGVAVASDGTAFVSDSGNHRLQVYSPSGVVRATIGVAGVAGADDAHSDTPRRLSFGSDGLL